MARLLLANDEPISRFQLSQFLTDEGYTVIAVGSGEEALQLLKTETFDAVITDFQLGGTINGIEVLSEHQRISPDRGRILITAYPSYQVKPETVGALYVPKPIQLDVLLAHLKSVLP